MWRCGTIPRALSALAIGAMAMIPAALPVWAQDLPSDEPLFVTASVDNNNPFIGQQITYICKIYQRSDLSHSLHYDPPGFAGFWNVNVTEQDEHFDTVDSKEYRVIELRTVLFPSVVETIEIGPAEVTMALDQSHVPIVVESASVTVEVRPPPAAAPPGFTGAVGSFEISAGVDARTGRMNEAIQLTVRIEGNGNIDALPDPAWPQFVGWRVVESPTTAYSEVIEGQLVGSRTYESILVPEMSGELTIPEVMYAHYDPELEMYVEAATEPIVVSVAEADTTTLTPSVGGMEAELFVSGPKRIKDVPQSLRQSSGTLTDSVFFWAAWALPFLVIIAAAAWRRRRDAWEVSLVDSRRRNALTSAQSTLRRAVAAGDDRAIAAADAVLSYISDRFGESLVGLTREAIGYRLQYVGVTSELAQQIEDTLAFGEAARFAPEAPPPALSEECIEGATQLLIALEEVIDT